jgi:E3 ubiquitin-protein ligase HUWE1
VLFAAAAPVLAVFLPALCRVDAAPAREVLRAYLRRGAADGRADAAFAYFLRHVRPRALLQDEEALLLPLLRRLIDERPHEHALIDRLFAALGRGRTDGPADGDAPQSAFWRLVCESRDFVSARVSADPRLLETVYAFVSPHQSILSFHARFKKFAGRIRERRSRARFSMAVRRSDILADSFQQLCDADVRTWLGVVHVSFANEPGVDGGGLLREWLSCLGTELFRPGHALFRPTRSSSRSFEPNPGSAANPRHLAYFEFAGKVFALAVVNSVHMQAHLALPFLKRLLARPAVLDDLADIDEIMHSGMRWILENSVADLPSELVFAAAAPGGQVDLKEGGGAIPVTDANKHEYVELLVEHRLRREIEAQQSAFCQGFYALIPLDEISVFDPGELDSVFCGENVVDVADWKVHCEFMGVFSASHPVIALFFEVLGGWSQENLSRLLAFTTGSPQVPLGGFAAFREAGRPIVINPGGGKERLVTAHTCVNTLDLPLYETSVEMNEKLMYAIDNCAGYGFK